MTFPPDLLFLLKDCIQPDLGSWLVLREVASPFSDISITISDGTMICCLAAKDGDVDSLQFFERLCQYHFDCQLVLLQALIYNQLSVCEHYYTNFMEMSSLDAAEIFEAIIHRSQLSTIQWFCERMTVFCSTEPLYNTMFRKAVEADRYDIFTWLYWRDRKSLTLTTRNQCFDIALYRGNSKIVNWLDMQFPDTMWKESFHFGHTKLIKLYNVMKH